MKDKKMKYDILGFCSENYTDCYKFSIESWLATNARKIYIYTDGWEGDTKDGRIVFVNITQKDTNWINNVGKKLDCILDYWEREDSIDNFCFLDVDNYITSDISEVFETIKTIGLTRIDLPHKTVSAGNVFLIKNNLSKKFLHEWKALQESHRESQNWPKDHWGVAYDQTSLHELTWNDINNTNEYQITSLVSKIWNCEHNIDKHWLDKIKTNKCKILHFKAHKWKDKKLVDEIKSIVANYDQTKNIVFIMNIKLNDSTGRYTSDRSLPYKFSINSWKYWCDTHNVELFVLEDLILPKEDMSICWQRYYLFDILEANDIDYDQILMVDSDTIVHPNCPNIFEMTDHKYTAVHNEGSYDWILRSIENYSKYIFQGREIKWWDYINGGLQIVNKNHKQFFSSMIDLYNNNKNKLIQMQDTYHTGTDQTPLNFMLQMNDVDTKLLPYEFNMTDMTRKEILNNDLTMTNVGWIYHFNALPDNHNSQKTMYWMKKTYEYFYGSLEKI